MKLKLLGYFLFVVACIVFSLYVHFPGQTIATDIENRMLQLLPEAAMQIEPVVPCFPLGVKTAGITFGNGKSPLIAMQNVRFLLDLTTLFADSIRTDVKADLLEGVLEGRVGMPRKTPRDLEIETRVQRIQLNQVHLERILSGCQVSAVVDATLNAALKENNIQALQGEMNLVDLVLQFDAPRFSIETFSFSTGNMTFDMAADYILNIQSCVLKGRQADIHSSGTVHVSPEVKKSRLDIKAKIVLYPLFFMNAGESAPIEVEKNKSDNAMVFLHITGTIETPVIAMDQGTK